MLTDTRVTEEQIQVNTNSYLEGSNDLPLSSYNTKISKCEGTQKDTKLRFSKMLNTKYGPNIQNSIKLAQYRFKT